MKNILIIPVCFSLTYLLIYPAANVTYAVKKQYINRNKRKKKQGEPWDLWTPYVESYRKQKNMTWYKKASPKKKRCEGTWHEKEDKVKTSL